LATENQDGFQTVSHKRKQRHKPAVKLIGKRAASDNVKTVTRRLVCFVGRLEHNTSEDDLANYLADAGIADAKCSGGASSKNSPGPGKVLKIFARSL